METPLVVNHVLHCRFKLFVQSCRRSLHKVDVVSKSVVVVCTKLTLFAQSFVQRKKKVGKRLILILKPL